MKIHILQSPSRFDGDVCGEPIEAGDCDSYVINYGFNTTLGRCQAFYYGGCGGTSNRFNSSEECEARCESQQPPSQGKFQNFLFHFSIIINFTGQ